MFEIDHSTGNVGDVGSGDVIPQKAKDDSFKPSPFDRDWIMLRNLKYAYTVHPSSHS